MNSFTRRAFAQLLAAIPAASASLPSFANITGKLLVGYPAGGTLDATARHLAEALRRGGRSFIVDNRPGAAGRIASSQLKREPTDGSTMLCTHMSALTIFPYAYAKL